SHPRIQVRRIHFIRGGWAQKLQYVLFLLWTLWWTWRWRPQWIYASDPFSCPIVWWIRKLIHVRVVYHEHDSPAPNEAQTWFIKQIVGYRREVARDVELCVLPQRTRLSNFLKSTGRAKPAYCVWNCPSREEIANLNSHQDHDNSDRGQGLIVFYHGS